MLTAMVISVVAVFGGHGNEKRNGQITLAISGSLFLLSWIAGSMA